MLFLGGDDESRTLQAQDAMQPRTKKDLPAGAPRFGSPGAPSAQQIEQPAKAQVCILFILCADRHVLFLVFSFDSLSLISLSRPFLLPGRK
jgi:hypothetical protein